MIRLNWYFLEKLSSENKNKIRTIEPQNGKISRKNKSTEAQPKFTGSYKKKSVYKMASSWIS